MRAAVLDALHEPLRVTTVPDPAPGAREVVIRTCSCGICGSDLAMSEGEGATAPVGCVMGHEFAGEVVALGAGVDTVRIGDRVAVLPIFGCGACAACLAGSPARCRRMIIAGTGAIPGGYAEYARAPAAGCLPLPESLSYDDGALVEPLAVSLRGVEMAAMRPGSRVLVLGAGPIGMTAMFWARRMGASRLVAAAPSRKRAAMALALGADAFLTTGEGHAAVREALGGPPDVVFECTGAGGMIDDAIHQVVAGGTVVVLGFCAKPDPISPAVAVLKEVCLRFSLAYDVAAYRHAIATLAAGATEARVMITDTVTLDGLPAAFEALRARGPQCKVMIHPGA